MDYTTALHIVSSRTSKTSVAPSELYSPVPNVRHMESRVALLGPLLTAGWSLHPVTMFVQHPPNVGQYRISDSQTTPLPPHAR